MSDENKNESIAGWMIIGFLFVNAGIILVAWNWAVPSLTGWPQIGYWQAFVLGLFVKGPFSVRRTQNVRIVT